MFAPPSGTNRLWCELWNLNYVPGTLSPLAGARAPDPRYPRPTPSIFITAWRGLFNSFSWGNLHLFKDPDACLVPAHSVCWNGASWKDRSLLLASAHRGTRCKCSRRQWACSFGGSAPGTPLPSTGWGMSYQRRCHNIPVLFKLSNDAVILWGILLLGQI